MLTESRNNGIVQTRTEVGKTASTGFDFGMKLYLRSIFS
jgi:hypothetical protein